MPRYPMNSRVYPMTSSGISPNSFNQFGTPEDAKAFWWASAKSESPDVCYMVSDINGYESNMDLRNRPIPLELETKVKQYIRIFDEMNAPDRESPRECQRA